MNFQDFNLTVRHLSKENQQILSELISLLDQNNIVQPYANFEFDEPAGAVLQLLEQHKTEHGTTIGYVQDGEGHLLGFAGLYYLPDVASYEAVFMMLPGYEDRTGYVLEYLVFEAFSNFGMDKICARALPGSAEAVLLRDNGFVYAGERAFAEEDMEQIWNYYELENEANMMSVPAHTTSVFSDWESIF